MKFLAREKARNVHLLWCLQTENKAQLTSKQISYQRMAFGDPEIKKNPNNNKIDWFVFGCIYKVRCELSLKITSLEAWCRISTTDRELIVFQHHGKSQAHVNTLVYTVDYVQLAVGGMYSTMEQKIAKQWVERRHEITEDKTRKYINLGQTPPKLIPSTQAFGVIRCFLYHRWKRVYIAGLLVLIKSPSPSWTGPDCVLFVCTEWLTNSVCLCDPCRPGWGLQQGGDAHTNRLGPDYKSHWLFQAVRDNAGVKQEGRLGRWKVSAGIQTQSEST